jgi:hypothetical protein
MIIRSLELVELKLSLLGIVGNGGLLKSIWIGELELWLTG